MIFFIPRFILTSICNVVYADFIRDISKRSVRRRLDTLIKADMKKDEVFISLTEMSRQFNTDLLDLLNNCKRGDKNYLDFLVL